MKIKKVVKAKVETKSDIASAMKTSTRISRNSCLDACTCTGNCE